MALEDTASEGVEVYEAAEGFVYMLRGKGVVDMLCEKFGMLGKLSIDFLIWTYDIVELGNI